jgi:hypothetical protein
LGAQVKKGRMGNTCGYIEKENRSINFYWENLKTRNYPEDLSIDGVLILKGIQKNKMKVRGMDASASE